jgi:tripartite-type tricarboxylate transporter receptor subunit TctC
VLQAVLHYGIVPPAGTPRTVVERLNRELVAALAADEVRARLIAEGAEALPGSPEDYAADIDREKRKWSRIVRASGAKVE